MASQNADALLEYVEFARAAVLDMQGSSSASQNASFGWSWVMARVLSCCQAYPSGVTSAILMSDLYQAWLEKERIGFDQKGKTKGNICQGTIPMQGKKKQQELCLSKISTIDLIYEKKFVSLDAILEVVVLDIQILPGTSTYLLTLGDAWSTNTIDHYLHRKFYDLISQDAVLKIGRELRLTGCRLRTTLVGSGQPRLLPTEYLVLLLDEGQDDDALLLGAQFCNDTFSTVQPSSTTSDHYLYARLKSIGEGEMGGSKKHLKQQELILVDSNNDLLPLILWDEQVLLASLFSEGSMIAIERPYIASDNDCGTTTNFGVCLEYGSATRLYAVPYVHSEEQVAVGSTQRRSMSANPPWSKTSQTLAIREDCIAESQVLLPRNSQGSVDFNRFPFRLLIEDLRPKMSNVALYGTVIYLGSYDIENVAATYDCKRWFLIKLQDYTGVISIKLQFKVRWSAGVICSGSVVFLSGINTCAGDNGRLECSWTEGIEGASIVNVTRLPAILTSPSLHKVVPFSSTICWINGGQICRMRISKLDLDHVHVRRCHTHCGTLVVKQEEGWHCKFCKISCEGSEISDIFYLFASFQDVNSNSGPSDVQVVCPGLPASVILQVSPDVFCTWPQDEQAIYLFSLQGEEFLVSLFKDCSINGSAVGWGIGNVDLRSYYYVGSALKC